jgi:hypothetical protein
MIQISLLKRSQTYHGFKIAGHAMFAESGQDIVCAAVSVLAYTALNATHEVAGISTSEMQFKIDEKKGVMTLFIDHANESTSVILKTFEVGILLLLEDFNENISLNYEEV